MAKFFIDRPIFAWVIAIVIMLAGLFAVLTLPVEQYPRIAPPSINVSTTYRGASAETLENSVTQIIEQKLTGIDNLRYFSSVSDSTGNLEIKLTFEPEADPDIAQVQVQNKIQTALSSLPQEVQQQGVTVKKSSSGTLLVVGLYSSDGSMDQNALSDYANSKLLDPISRLKGVGDATIFGQPYAMRIWLNPEKMYSYSLITSDIIAAVKTQNADVSVGQLGGSPAVEGQQLNATINAQSKLQTVEEFENIFLKVNTGGSQVRLKDVAKVELGVENYNFIAKYNGKPATGLSISLGTGANALDTADRIKAKLDELSTFMPEGLEIVFPYDTTPFVSISIKEVVKTLLEAIVLVFLVMYLFLQNFRATLIPTIAVPVVLLGTFGMLSLFGFTINTLTMFAMVLAIGLLVDDAIVVVENVERVMNEEGLSPKEATKKSMQQITGALVGIALVLSAVFVPMAFFNGSTGAIYRQFSLTIVSAMTLSVLVALILTPALCATLLTPVKKGHKEGKRGFFGWFNRVFDRSKKAYGTSIDYVVARTLRFILIYGVIVGVMIFLFTKIPTSFLPDEDQGIMLVSVVSPPGATLERTRESVAKIEDYLLTEEKENVESVMTVTGFSFAGRGQNTGIGFVKLKHWDERTRPDQKVAAIARRSMQKLSSVKDSSIYAFFPPSIIELGTASGFDVQLVDRAGLGHEVLVGAKDQLLSMASQHPELSGVRHNGLSDVSQYQLDLNLEKAQVLGVSVEDINATLQAVWGSAYINDFMHEQRVKKVYVQGEAPYRMLPENVNDWYVRNSAGKMVSFSTFTDAHWTYGSPRLERYNGTASMEILGAPAQGISSGEAMSLIEDMGKQLPRGIGLDWTSLSYEERMAGSQTPLLYSLSLLIVFLCLAALYESWSIPIAVLLVVPLGIIGAVAATLLANLSNDVYFQVGLLTTIGLASKNAILIVEFAKDLYEKGEGLLRSATIAAEQRLRPILMTSLAFILGVTPLALSSGAGSASQNAIGVGVIGGMISATFLAIFFVPLSFVLVEKMLNKRHKKTADSEVHHAE